MEDNVRNLIMAEMVRSMRSHLNNRTERIKRIEPSYETATTATETRENTEMNDSNDTKAPTELDRIRTEVLDNLARLGKVQTGDDALIYEGTKFVLPTTMAGKSLDVAIRYLRDFEEQMNAEFDFSRTFNYRPWDGANAFQRAMLRTFGTTGIGQAIPATLFTREQKPEYITIADSADTTIQIPWGTVRFAPLEATFYLQGTRSKELGILFVLQVEAPRKYRSHIDAFFQVVEDELKSNSIYRGKAFTGGDEPVFMNTGEIDPKRVVYTDDVLTQLTTNLWSVLRYSDRMKAAGVPLKRSVLVEGPYGTGKTMAGQLTAREAVQNGWTFIINRAGKDNLEQTLQTAQLYAPSVVWFEDIDVIAAGKSEEQVSRLLDSLDSITNKGVAVVAGFTTNHVDKIQKGVLRPGRLDAVIHIGALDDAAMEKLIRATLPGDLTGDIDFATVAKAFAGFLPAFAKEATDRAIRYSLVRGEGNPLPVTTDDLVNAAKGLRPQLALMEEAVEGIHRDSLSVELERLFRRAADGVDVIDTDDDSVAYKLADQKN
jgi:transitional endoplasmic reticulum ATPase